MRAIRHARSPQRPATLKIRMAPQRERSNTHEARRGFAGDVENPQGTTTGAFRHARNPQRFSPGNCQIRKAPQQERFDTHETRRVAEGSPVTLKIRAAPQRERSDTHETRKCFRNKRKQKADVAMSASSVNAA